MTLITILGILMALWCVDRPAPEVEPRTLVVHPHSVRPPEQYAQDLAECRARIAAELAAERPALSPRVAAFGHIGAAMDEDIERHKAVAKLWICLEMHDYVLEHKPSPSPEWYLNDLLACAQPIQEAPHPDAALVRTCMAARGHQVPW